MKYSKTFVSSRYNERYEIIDGWIKPVGEHGGIYSPWEYASDVFEEMARIDNAKTPNKVYMHFEFAACKNSNEMLEWVSRFGLPYLSSSVPWWEASIDQSYDETPLKTSELLMWANVMDWVLQVVASFKSEITRPELTPDILTTAELMKIDLEDRGMPYVKKNVATGELSLRHMNKRLLIAKSIMNRATSKVYPHMFFSRTTPCWGWGFANLMQFMFLNVLSDMTGGKTLKQCACGRFFPRTREDKIYHDKECRKKLRDARKNERKKQKRKEMKPEKKKEAQSRER